jgi:hypothetical protein
MKRDIRPAVRKVSGVVMAHEYYDAEGKVVCTALPRYHDYVRISDVPVSAYVAQALKELGYETCHEIYAAGWPALKPLFKSHSASYGMYNTFWIEEY